MEITEVRVKLVERPSERLRAFCSVTLDGDFVIRDLKIIGGANGAFVAMPSRKLADRCPRCGCKNHLRAKYCNECGGKLSESRAPKDAQGRAKLHADVAHPINAACRERIQAAVIKAYEAELERAKSPDYKPPTFDDLDEDFVDEEEVLEAAETPRKDKSNKGNEDHQDSEDGFDDYNSLIADLKREAATREEKRRERQRNSFTPRPSGQQPREDRGQGRHKGHGRGRSEPARAVATARPAPAEPRETAPEPPPPTRDRRREAERPAAAVSSPPATEPPQAEQPACDDFGAGLF